MSFHPTSPLLAMGLRHPRNPLPNLFPRPLPIVSYPSQHPLRSQYPHPNVHHVANRIARVTDYSPPASHGPATHYRIQLKRSPIGLPEVYGKTLQRLGLLKKDRTVYAPFGATVAGQILRVKELVTVRNVSWWQMEDEMKRGKGWGKGLREEKGSRERKGKRFGTVGEEFGL